MPVDACGVCWISLISTVFKTAPSGMFSLIFASGDLISESLSGSTCTVTLPEKDASEAGGVITGVRAGAGVGVGLGDGTGVSVGSGSEAASGVGVGVGSGVFEGSLARAPEGCGFMAASASVINSASWP